jgi:hypothetical protein
MNIMYTNHMKMEVDPAQKVALRAKMSLKKMSLIL